MERNNIQHTYKSYLPYLFLLLFSIPLFFLNIRNAHTIGGDDYAQYIKEAQNIAHGRPFYESNYVFNKYNSGYAPPQYPPGFPLLLAPVVKIWGIAIEQMCYFNTLIAVCLLFSFFAYFRKYTGVVAAICLSVVITYSGWMIDLKSAVLSDAPALLFVMLYLITRNAATFNWKRITLLVVFAAMAMLIRTQSVLLLFAEAIYLFLFVINEARKTKRFSLQPVRRSPSLYVIAGTLLITVFLSKVVFYCPASAAGFYVDYLKLTLHKGIFTIIRDNISALLVSITTFFHYDTNRGIRTAMVTVMESTGLVFCTIGFIISVTRRLSFDDIFFVLVCALVLYYPVHDPRFFLPAVAIVFYYVYTALQKILPVITTVQPLCIGIALTIIYLVAGVNFLLSTTKTPWGLIPGPKDEQAFSYISKHVNDSDLIICPSPRMITLYTNKRCIIHAWQEPMATNKKIFDSMQARYLLITGLADEYYHTYLNQYQHPIDSINISQGYTLYTLR